MQERRNFQNQQSQFYDPNYQKSFKQQQFPNNRPLIQNQFDNIGDQQQNYGTQQDFTPEAVDRWGRRTWFLFAAFVCFGLVVVAGVVLASVFSGIASRKTCPDCICPAPLSNENAIRTQNLYEKSIDIESMLLEKLTIDKSFGFRKCVNKCYDHFVNCPLDSREDDCKRKTGITKNCDSISMCMDKCNSLCPISEHPNVIAEDEKCLNKHNFFEVCPTDSES